MKFIESLCPPALLYALFLAVQLGFDIADLALFTAASKLIFGGATVYILDLLCRLKLGVVAWVFIAAPFFITALGTSIAIGLEMDRTLYSALA